jgi:hypothetical protein
MTTDMKSVATTVSTVDEAVMTALPFISGILGFIPGAQVAVPFMPLVSEGLMALDNAAKAVAAGNPGAAIQDVMKEVMDHLTPGKPNSPILSATVTANP